jgi:hypothetical protein
MIIFTQGEKEIDYDEFQKIMENWYSLFYYYLYSYLFFYRLLEILFRGLYYCLFSWNMPFINGIFFSFSNR